MKVAWPVAMTHTIEAAKTARQFAKQLHYITRHTQSDIQQRYRMKDKETVAEADEELED